MIFERLVSIALAAALLSTSAIDGFAAEKKLSFRKVASVQVDYGSDFNNIFMLAVGDFDGDGADDFATAVTAQNEGQPAFRSFVFRNDTDTGKPQAVDLGDEGASLSVWHGLFYTDELDGLSYFALGRNGEVGSNRGEQSSIFRLEVADGKATAIPVYVAKNRHLTANLARCDVDGDGTVELWVNNYGSPNGDDFDAPYVIQRAGDGTYRETPGKVWLPTLTEHGAHNSVSLKDIDADGDCDMLLAFEVAKWEEDNTPSFPGEDKSYVLLNNDGRFDGEPIFLPNSAFGPDHAGFSLEVLEDLTGKLFFLHSSQFENPEGWHDNALQAYRFENGAFVEVTEKVIDRQFPMWSANQSFIRFNDIDHDGDQDLYFSLQTGDIAFYRNLGDGTFRLEKVADDPGHGSKGVAFLNNPTTKCSDLVIATRQPRIERFICR